MTSLYLRGYKLCTVCTVYTYYALLELLLHDTTISNIYFVHSLYHISALWSCGAFSYFDKLYRSINQFLCAKVLYAGYIYLWSINLFALNFCMLITLQYLSLINVCAKVLYACDIYLSLINVFVPKVSYACNIYVSVQFLQWYFDFQPQWLTVFSYFFLKEPSHQIRSDEKCFFNTVFFSLIDFKIISIDSSHWVHIGTELLKSLKIIPEFSLRL